MIPHSICKRCLAEIPADSDVREMLDDEIVMGDQACCWCGEKADDGLYLHQTELPPKCSCP